MACLHQHREGRGACKRVARAGIWTCTDTATPSRGSNWVSADGSDLDRTDAALDAGTGFENTSSIRTVSLLSPLSFSALLRGPASLGTLYANNGFRAVPSTADPRLDGDDYFNGGVNTARHSCGSDATALGGITAGDICGVQIESNYTGVRDNAANRDRFGDATAVRAGRVPPGAVGDSAATANCEIARVQRLPRAWKPVWP
jgi:hypothetical protein